MTGAGGTAGGIWRFFAGLAMMIVGGYFFFDSIRVESGYRWGDRHLFLSSLPPRLPSPVR